jgi:hypothetical protein
MLFVDIAVSFEIQPYRSFAAKSPGLEFPPVIQGDKTGFRETQKNNRLPAITIRESGFPDRRGASKRPVLPFFGSLSGIVRTPEYLIFQSIYIDSVRAGHAEPSCMTRALSQHPLSS